MGNEEVNQYKKAKFKQSNEFDPNSNNKDNNPNPQNFYDKGTNILSGGILDKAEDQFSDKKRQEKANIASIQGSLADDIRKVYTFKDVLGGGHFGTVRTAFKKDAPNKLYAIKSIKTKKISQQDLKDLMREVEIISSLNHPNIVKFYETYHDKHFFHIVMELCTGTELFKKIIKDGKITEQMVSKIISKVLQAIAYCHSKGITHRDLKPENILIETNCDEPEVKLIDFGFSRKYSSNEKMHTILGTPFYIAPEVLKGAYDEKCDVWSIGILTYIMLSGEPPFFAKSNGEIFKKIVHSPLGFPKKKWEKISIDAINFIKKCLEKNADKRYSAVDALNDNWFKHILDELHNEDNINLDVLNNLKSFTKPEKFKTLVLNYIVNHVSDEELIKLKNAFIAIDLNHSGHINAKELESAFKTTGLNVSKDELSSIMEAAEVDDTEDPDGKIEYNEFLIACMNQKANIRKENLINAFKYFDIDDSGFIDSTDIKNALLRSGQKDINENEINDIIKEVCQDNEKKISLDTFLKMFKINE